MSEENTILIKEMDMPVRTKNTLTALGVRTVYDLHMMYILDTLPKVGTRVNHRPYVDIPMKFTRKMNKRVKTILKCYCGIKDLKHVGKH